MRPHPLPILLVVRRRDHGAVVEYLALLGKVVLGAGQTPGLARRAAEHYLRAFYPASATPED